MQIRDRIRELRRVRADQLRPNPQNWRVHPPEQQDVLRGILSEIGYASALIARELPDGSLELIDGHLRAETTPEQLVPVVVVDVDERESRQLLAVLDPSSALAATDHTRLADLLSETDFESDAVRRMVDSLAPRQSVPGGDASPHDAPEELFQLVIDCPTESDQRQLFERLSQEGWTCRVLVL